MAQVSHTVHPVTVEALLLRAARRLQRSGVFFGHGTDNARDEAAALLWHVMGLPWPAPARVGSRRVTRAQQAAFETLLVRRIRAREPAVYVTGRIWFAGIPLRTDSRALIPRSPLAELIERQFVPWVDPRNVRRVLDMGTGSGCIAIACAAYLPKVRVDAVDVSREALALARANVRELGLARRVRCIESDHFAALAGRRYDIIVSNPPYVSEREMRGLPAEYAHEPRGALAAGRDGLDSVRVIVRDAPAHLNPGGLLVVEVGNSERAVRRTWRHWPFTWLSFERGGGGVFALRREQWPANSAGS